MVSRLLPRQSNAAELRDFDQLCQRLCGFDASIGFEFVDGYLAALAAGPRLPALDEAVLRLGGDAFDRAFADPEDRAWALRTLKARLSVLQDQLDAEALYDDLDALRLDPLLAEWTEEDRQALRAEAAARGRPVTADDEAAWQPGADWALGFDSATDDFADLWAAPAEDDEEAALYAELRAEITSLYLPPEDGDGAPAATPAEAASEAGVEPAPEAESEPDRDRRITDACYAVQDLRLWWVERAPKPETRRVEPQPGRNDPCPCGSGKKFKKCHGA